MKKKFLVFAALAALAVSGFGQTRLTENTIRIEKEAKGAAAKVSDMEWMAGSWSGNAFDGQVTEVWTKTGGGMIGMFSLVVKDKPVFYELMTFAVVDGELFLKLKHFNPDMTGWEERDETVDFRFIKKDGNRFYFNGLTFENADQNSVNIYLALHMKDKTLKEEVFQLKRVN